VRALRREQLSKHQSDFRSLTSLTVDAFDQPLPVSGRDLSAWL
jgi:hypothetical protein